MLWLWGVVEAMLVTEWVMYRSHNSMGFAGGGGRATHRAQRPVGD